MSVKVMGMVWDLAIPTNQKFVLLAYADHADHDGGRIHPAVATIMSKTGYDRRSIQRITRQLEEEGYLVETGMGPKGTNEFKIPIVDDKIHPEGRQNDAPLGPEEGRQDATGGAANCHGGGGTHTTGGAAPMPPESSFNRPLNTAEEEDARARPEIFKIFEAEIGPITPHIADALKALEEDHPPEWIVAALRDASARGKRNLKYVQAILKRWAVEGYGTAPPWEREVASPGERFAAGRKVKKGRPKPPEESEEDLAKRREAAAKVLETLNHGR